MVAPWSAESYDPCLAADIWRVALGFLGWPGCAHKAKPRNTPHTMHATTAIRAPSHACVPHGLLDRRSLALCIQFRSYKFARHV